jgi:molecular chaperone DnaJ
MKKDYYEILGLKHGASIEDVKRAYKRLAKKYHPDVSNDPNAEEKFKEILEAYQVLSDPQRKANYDRFGHSAERFTYAGSDFGNFGMGFDFEDLFNNFASSGFSKIFNEFFRERQSAEYGNNIRVDVNLTFEEAAFGTEKEVRVYRMEKCEECDGRGYGEEGGVQSCPVCHGTGHISYSRSVGPVFMQSTRTCHNCKGRGSVITRPCKRCKGEGKVRTSRKIAVKIPAGVDTGWHLRLRGQGDYGKDGCGDLFVVVFVEPHPVFKRDGADIFCEIPISFSEAALGCEVEVPTLNGKAKLHIPAGTQSNTVFKLPRKGLKKMNGSGYGDLFVKVVVETPKKLSKEERRLFQELARLEQLKKERKGFVERFIGKFRKSVKSNDAGKAYSQGSGS